MNMSLQRCSLTLGVLLALVQGQGSFAASVPHLADYDSEPRRADGRVDVPGLVERLKELRVTHYYWLVWHAATDWDDLKLFLPEAAKARINTWVYLVPPTEGPPHYPASEPFKLDYVRWAEEIAKLSLQHTNLTGWVIDDFYANSAFFTPSYVGRMRDRAKAINPQLRFLPLMYFPEITSLFVNNYHDVIDGVVVAYPTDRDEIVHARAVLDGGPSMAPGELSYPWQTPSRAGDFVSASIPAQVLTIGGVRLRFKERDDFAGPTSGYHFKQVLIDGSVAWEQDVAGGSKQWQNVDLDLADRVRGKTNVTVAFRLFDKKGVGNFGVRWRIGELQGQGLRLVTTSVSSREWRVEKQGPFAAGFALPQVDAKPRFHIPFIVMTAGVPDEFRLRHGDPATPPRMADWLRFCLEAWRDGQCDGVVTYCLDKRPDSQIFPRARQLFGEFQEAGR